MKQVLFKGYDQEGDCWRYGYYYRGTLTDQPLCLGDCRNYKTIITGGVIYHCTDIQQQLDSVDDTWEYVDIDYEGDDK